MIKPEVKITVLHTTYCILCKNRIKVKSKSYEINQIKHLKQYHNF